MTETSDCFCDSDYGVGPPLTAEMVQAAEAALGYKVPSAYLDLLRMKNGGILRRDCFQMQTPTGWAEDHVQVRSIAGIGGENGIDSRLGSRYLIKEWEYPDVGIVIGWTPSGGHEVIMLDYSLCGAQGEPRVIYVDMETRHGKPDVVVMAPDFAAFLQGLVERSVFEQKNGI